MRTISYFLSLSSLVLQTDAKLNLKIFENHSDDDFLKSLTPNDVGILHNTVMVKVHDRILENMPQTHEHFSAIVYEEMSALCTDADYECKQDVHDMIVRSKYEVKELFATGGSYDLSSSLPEDIDEAVADSLIRIHKSLHILDKVGLKEYHDELDQISSEAESSEMAEVHKVIVQSVASIARSSGEFWTEVVENEESIAHQNSNRLLQLEETEIVITFNTLETTEADIIGAVKGAVDSLIEDPLQIINVAALPSSLLPDVLRGAIGASLLAMGIPIQVPTATEFTLCLMEGVIENQDGADFDSIPVLSEILNEILVPCNSTTLFGPFLGPIFADLLPPIAIIIDDPVNETISPNNTMDKTVPSNESTP